MATMPGNDPMEKPEPLDGLDPAELLRQGVAEDTMLDESSSAFQPPPIGELAPLFPQFDILELIGKGGMGAVYKVRQKDLDRVVALKILPPAIGQSPEFSERFTREARALAKLNHPGIVTLHEFGQRDGLYFILMEFVDGVNLAQLMKNGRVSAREALAIVPQICDALQYAHDQGIVHRDIKPENILLDRLGRVKVADFGIAKVVAAVCDPLRSGDTPVPENQTLAGKIIGTPQYMAPEQIEHPSDVDHRADIYALGVVFYQMLTGELPEKDLQAPSSRMRGIHIDVRLDEIVLQALEKSPQLRYQTAGEFRTRVETIVSEKGSANVPPAAYNSDLGTASTGSALTDSRFSRMAIVGACWAPLLLVMLLFWNLEPSRVLPGVSPPKPSSLQLPLTFILLPLGLAAPFGTTILGWIAVSQIRRSEGRLRGMWLAVFDGLLFPLLLIAGLIGWFWHWVFYDLMRAAIIAGSPELTTMQRLLVANTTPFTVLATLATSLVAGILIVLGVWRTVNTNGQSMPSKTTNKSLAIGCGALALAGVLISGVALVPLILRNSSQQMHRQFMADFDKEVARAKARAEELEAAASSETGSKLADYHWNELAANGRIGDTFKVLLDGRICLKIENPNDAPMTTRLLTIDKPLIKAMRYAIRGEIRYWNVQGRGYLEMWSEFPEGRYFSRTLGTTGPTSVLTGNSGWREFTLPFDRTGTADAPGRIEINLHLPGRGWVFVGPLELMEFSPAEVARDGGPKASPKIIHEDEPRRTGMKVDENTSSSQEMIPFRELPAANRLQLRMVAPDDPQAVDVIQIREDGDRVPLKLDNNVIVCDRHVIEADIQRSNDAYEIRITLNETGEKRLAAATKDADGTMRLAVLVDGEVKSTPVVMSQLGRQFAVHGFRDLEKCLETVRDLVDWPDDRDTSAMMEWMEKIDQGKAGEAWAIASEYLRQNLSSEKFVEMTAKARQPLGSLETRRLSSAKRMESPPGAPEGLYLVSEFDSSFTNKKEAKELVTLHKEKDGHWRICGYFIR